MINISRGGSLTYIGRLYDRSEGDKEQEKK